MKKLFMVICVLFCTTICLGDAHSDATTAKTLAYVRLSYILNAYGQGVAFTDDLDYNIRQLPANITGPTAQAYATARTSCLNNIGFSYQYFDSSYPYIVSMGDNIADGDDYYDSQQWAYAITSYGYAEIAYDIALDKVNVATGYYNTAHSNYNTALSIYQAWFYGGMM